MKENSPELKAHIEFLIPLQTGSSGDSAEITASQKPVQMFGNIDMEDGLLGDHLEQSSLDHKIFKDLLGFPDPLADDSMDSFVDLSCFMGNAMETYKDQDDAAATSESTCPIDEGMMNNKVLKRRFSAVSLVDSSLAEPLVIEKPSCHDHAYVAKRSKKSELKEELSVENDHSVSFCTNPESPLPSTSHTKVSENRYRNRREKNNIASKRSREVRKQKFVDMEKEASRLEIENASLEKRIVELEQLAKQMKEILVAKMAGK
ncbi:hypothetical protein C0Q70_03062 [Pomacea canaliculata]|uniref:BZIP domain-containing protein n=1 Tax=Pomacea canaliculata TaxID=400727 RepID=A0A2T7PRN8_POMCA|nr:hypothetical protein C0Q70_03062 [Pomacea canaliculata]